MHPPSQDKPTQGQLVFPLLRTLQDMGGTGKARDVAGALADHFRLDEDVRSERVTTADGQQVNLWQRHVRFARQKCVAMGYLRSDGHGRWAMTDEGGAGVRAATPAVTVTVFVDAAGQPRSAQVDIAVGLPTIHTLHRGDSRDLSWISNGEVPLIVTSCPYFDVVEYEHEAGQLADFASYEAFLQQLDQVWRECWRVLAPGGRLACNVADVLRSRKAHGTHHVLPLHADILVRSRSLGFQALTGIMWRKITRCSYEQGPGGLLGKPGQPNGVIKSELEHILLLKKPGPYRSPAAEQAAASAITKAEHAAWYRPVWDDVPGTRDRRHPAPFPVEIPYRLIRMFSFAGDTVLDPFGGRFTTTAAAMRAGRNSIGVEIAPSYFAAGVDFIRREASRGAAT